MPESGSNSLRHWETYYRGGALASCPLGPDAGYTQELRDVWVEFFSALPDGARILDVGTGNGAIALMASQAAAAVGKRFEIHGTDLAQIDPERDVANGARLFAGIHFHSRVATEQLPFESDSFDAVSGQYALEYTDTDRSLPEIRRVLTAGGITQFILHHADSVITRNARESLAQSALVLQETRVLRRLRRYCESGLRSPTAARSASDDLSAAMQKLIQAARQSSNPHTLNVTIDAVQKLLQARTAMTVTALGHELDRFEEDLRAAARRLQDLVRGALTEAQLNRIAGRAADVGLAVMELAVQHHGGSNLVGWRLRLLAR